MKVKSSLSYKITYYFFHLICTSATIFFVSFCLYKYSLNKDLSQVTYKEFHKTNENIYPSLTLCFASIFYEGNLKEYGVQSINEYANFMDGEYWNDRMIDVNYEKVTLNISDYVLGFVSKTPAWTAWIPYGDEYIIYDHTKNIQTLKNGSISTYDWIPKMYTSYAGSVQKCMTVDIPFTQGKKVWTFAAVFNSIIFPNRTRPAYYEFGIKVHYPGQLSRPPIQKYVWKSRENKTSDTSGKNEYLTMKFKLQKLEVIRHRETSTEPCNKNWKEDDETMLRQKIKRIGCKPSYLKVSSDYPTCKSQKHMKMFTTFNLSHYHPPCVSIQKILYAYEEYDDLEDWTYGWMNETNDIFEVILEFMGDTYMEIEQVRSYGFQDVVGDIGGYLGLFLGFSLLQIPQIINAIMSGIEILVRRKNFGIPTEKHMSLQKDHYVYPEFCQCQKETERMKLELKETKSKLHQLPLVLEALET